ncbi:unnamed protein product [Amoebophrya sp. A120]|nr:unnamed protein product [Amoebophrya sp. A120]|eukprot:GSA120T00011833001.1
MAATVGTLGSDVVGVISPGTEVQIEGLQNAAHLNGLKAIVVEYDQDNNRYKVHVEDDSNIALRAQNFRILSVAAAPDVVIGQASSPNPGVRLSQQSGSPANASSLSINVPPPTTVNQQSTVTSILSRRDSEDALFHKLGWTDYVLCGEFPLFTKSLVIGGLWMFLVTMLLIYAPR